MPMFVKRPIKIEARQFTSNTDPKEKNINDIVFWVARCHGKAMHDHKNIYIKTLEGVMRADVEDWIIKGVGGEFYPCKPDIFEATYKPLKEKAK